MTGKADFTQDEWKLVLEAPPSAGLIVLTAQKGGTFRETIAMAKVSTSAAEARPLGMLTSADRITLNRERLRSLLGEVMVRLEPQRGIGEGRLQDF